MDDVPGCRGCGSTSLVLIQRHADFGASARASVTGVSHDAPVSEHLALCRDCALVQTIGTGPTIQRSHGEALATRPELTSWQARQLASHVAAAQKLRPTSLVVEIGSRDGCLLQTYQAAGVPVLGIEPAVRLAELARLEHGVPTVCRHFTKHLAQQLEGCGQQADVVHVHHVLPVLVDVEGFLAGLAIVLAPSGVAVVDVPYVKQWIDRGNSRCLLTGCGLTSRLHRSPERSRGTPCSRTMSSKTPMPAVRYGCSSASATTRAIGYAGCWAKKPIGTSSSPRRMRPMRPTHLPAAAEWPDAGAPGPLRLDATDCANGTAAGPRRPSDGGPLDSLDAVAL